MVVIRHGVGDGRAIPGTALTISAWSGMSWAMGNADAAPLTLPYDLGAYQAGIHACAAGLAALVARPERTDLRHVDVSSRDVVAYFTGMIAANFIPYERAWAREGSASARLGRDLPGQHFSVQGRPCRPDVPLPEGVGHLHRGHGVAGVGPGP